MTRGFRECCLTHHLRIWATVHPSSCANNVMMIPGKRPCRAESICPVYLLISFMALRPLWNVLLSKLDFYSRYLVSKPLEMSSTIRTSQLTSSDTTDKGYMDGLESSEGSPNPTSFASSHGISCRDDQSSPQHNIPHSPEEKQGAEVQREVIAALWGSEQDRSDSPPLG